MNSDVKNVSYVGEVADELHDGMSSETSALRISQVAAHGLIRLSAENDRFLAEPLSLPTLHGEESTANGFQITQREELVDFVSDEERASEPLITNKQAQTKYNEEKLQNLGKQVQDWFENTGVCAALITYFDGHIRVVAPENLDPLKRSSAFKEIFLKTLVQSSFSRKGGNKMHVVSSQNEEPESESAISCDECSKNFSNQSQLRSHKLLVHLPKESAEHRCEKCGKVFQAAAFLQTHLCNRGGQRDHECTVCGTRFTSGSSLKMHVRIHSAEKPFKCQTCGMAFPRRSSLNYHLTKHTGAREFQCKTCGKEFALLNNLKDHERIHTGEKPFSCQECGKSFTVSSTLRRHLLIHSGEKPFPCEICNSRFTRLIHLQSHMRVHSGERPFKCEECDKKFAQSSHLRRHQKIHDRERYRTCQKCGQEVKDKDDMQHVCSGQNSENTLRQLPFQFCNFDKSFVQT